MAGYVCLAREAFDNALLRDGKRFRAFFWMVARACWKPTQFDIGGKTVILQRGQFCASRAQLAAAWKWSPSAVERFLTRLQTEQMIGRETAQGQSVITILNYSKYQDPAEQTGQAAGQAIGQRADSGRTTKEEGKEGEEKKEGIDAASRVGAEYAFFGRTIKLKPADFDRWRARYHSIADLAAELGALDDWLEGQDEAKRKKWFHSVSGALNRKHQELLAGHSSDLADRFTGPC